MEERFLIRNGDVAFALAGAFILGIAAGTFGWNAPALFLLLFFVGIAAIYLCNAKRLWPALIASLFIFVIGVEYFHFFAPDRQRNEIASASQKKNAGATGFPSIIFTAVLPNQQAELLSAIINGSTAVINPDLKTQMSLSGTSYIVGMYGYKINLFAVAIISAGRRFFSRRIGFVLAALATSAFIIMAGAPISAIRAGIMMGLVLLAQESGRPFHVRNIFTFTVLVMLLSNPALLGEPSFQLSFLSLLGIFMLGPPCKRLFRYTGHELLEWKAHAIMALAVNAAIMPVVMLKFGDFSVTSFISNFLISIPLAIVIGVALAIATLGLISPHFAFLAAAIANIFLSYQLCVIKLFSIVVVPLPPLFQSGYFIALYYFLLAAFVIHYGKKENETMEQA